MATIDTWTAAVCADLGIEAALVDIPQILDLARDVAHQVDRPAAPVTAFLMGLAVGGGRQADETAARLRELANGWTSPSP
jgi:Domain of unknown function (DUF6457)